MRNSKYSFISFIIMITLTLTVSAQLKVFTNGNVGIDATSPTGRFVIGGNGSSDARIFIYNPTATTSYKGLRLDQALPTGTYVYGLFATVTAGSTSGWPNAIYGSSYRGSTAYSSGRTVGIKGVAGNASTGYNYGVYGVLSGTNYGAAIYGVVPGKGDVYVDGLYAGYFRGNVKMENDLYVLGTYNPSDINLKKEIRSLDKDNLSKLLQLQAIKYKLKNPIELNLASKAVTDTAKVLYSSAELNDPVYSQDFIGLSAQELQKVYPEMVRTEENGTLSVNYVSLIPVLIEAIKEQQVTINELKAKLDKVVLKN